MTGDDKPATIEVTFQNTSEMLGINSSKEGSFCLTYPAAAKLFKALRDCPNFQPYWENDEEKP